MNQDTSSVSGIGLAVMLGIILLVTVRRYGYYSTIMRRGLIAMQVG